MNNIILNFLIKYFYFSFLINILMIWVHICLLLNAIVSSFVFLIIIENLTNLYPHYFKISVILNYFLYKK